MNVNSKNRLPIYIGTWLATAVVTFCLGRISSPDSPAASGGPAAGGSAARTTSTSSSAFEPSSSFSGDSSDDALANWFGSKAESIEDVTNGRPLDAHVQHLLKQDDDAARMLGFLRLLEALKSEEDIKSVLDIIGKDRGGRFRTTEQSMLLQKWAKLDPKAAAAYVAEQRDFSRFAGANAVLRTWVKSNAEEAIAWAKEQGVSGGDDGEGGRGRGRGEDGNWAIATLIGPLAQQNLDRAIELAANEPQGRARGQMVNAIVEQLVSQRGEDAARHALMDLPDGEFRQGVAGELAQRFYRSNSENPQSVADWAKSLPAGGTRERALAQVMRDWANDDLVGAGNYLKSLGNGPEYDGARQSYAFEARRDDPAAALSWASTITNEEQRTRTTQGILADWARRSPNEAQAWARANNVNLGAVGGQGGPGGQDGRRFGGFEGRGGRGPDAGGGRGNRGGGRGGR